MAKIITGIQPSGIIHIGNYLAAIKPIVELSKDPRHRVMGFVANYHAMTSNTDFQSLRENTIDTFLNWLACGIDTEKGILYIQSDIPEVQEFTWFLYNLCPMGLLERSTAYRDKVENGLSANAGLFNYPVLMTADILMSDSEVVPVGKDQTQHLEISRDLAQKANRIWKLGFKEPQAYILDEVGVVPGLDGRKMSKSYHNTIPLFSNEKELRKKVMS
ncbi:MAG TPA: tryptophan--tRNA ligase, partial [Candidatus Gracilibacteria bacterium]|nr:tryptophan--tRNA ligase [Candidatus Gracilibacteria bacterium]